MIKYKVLVSICIGTFLYVLVSVTCGRNSVWAQNQLIEQKRILSTHKAEVEKINEELTITKLSLQKDKDVIASYAKRLSYIHDGEKIVKVSGLPVKESYIYNPGTVKLHEEVKYFPEWFCKVVGFASFAAVYVLLLMIDLGYVLVRSGQKKAYAPV